VFFANVASGLAHVKGGKLRVMAVTGAKRASSLPEVPTMAEAGIPGYEVYEWNAIFAPAGTPAPIVEKLAAAIAKAMQSPEIKERVATLGGDIAGYGPKEAEKFIREQTELWGKVVKAGNIKVD
jgi:tripartite-type tricarboxylate transporter receptor subunit TctC